MSTSRDTAEQQHRGRPKTSHEEALHAAAREAVERSFTRRPSEGDGLEDAARLMRDPDMHPETIRMLLTEPRWCEDVLITRAATSHPRTPEDILVEIVATGDRLSADQVICRPNLPRSVAEAALTRIEPHLLLAQAMASSRYLPTEMVETLRGVGHILMSTPLPNEEPTTIPGSDPHRGDRQGG